MYGYTRNHTLRLVRNPTPPPPEMENGQNNENNIEIIITNPTYKPSQPSISLVLDLHSS